MINTKGKRLLLINAGNARKIFILKILNKMGVEVVCLDREIKPAVAQYVKEWLIADLNNEKECVEKVKNYLEHADSLNGVWTFWEECVLLSSRIAEEFGWPGLPYSVVEKIKDKHMFREYCREQGVPAPQSLMLGGRVVLKDLKKLKFPIILKPVFGASSAFVVKVNNIRGVKKVFEYINRNVKSFWLSSEWRNLKVVAEEYVGGQEVDIDILVQGGILKYSAVTDNAKTNEPYFVETGQSMPSALNKKTQEKVLADAFVFLKKLGVSDGCIHFEAKVHKSFGLIPIELNLRMGGGDVYLFSKSVWGVDLVMNAVKIALGIDISVHKPKQPQVFLFGRQFLSLRSCIIKDILVNKKIFKNKNLVDLYFEKKNGDVFLAPPDGYDNAIGWLTVKGRSLADAKKNWLGMSRLVKISKIFHPQHIHRMALDRIKVVVYNCSHNHRPDIQDHVLTKFGPLGDPKPLGLSASGSGQELVKKF